MRFHTLSLLSALATTVCLFCTTHVFAESVVFGSNLRLGDRGTDVVALQRLLGVTETGYFGPLTQRAVMSFQSTYASEVLAPAGLTQPTGFVGQLTRQKLNSVANNAPATQAPTTPSRGSEVAVRKAPTVSRVLPDHGPYGAPLTIVGENFTGSNDILTTYLPFNALPSVDGHTISFTFVNPPFEKLQQLRNAGKIADMDIPFVITVVNQNGTSTPPVKYTIEIRKR